jgi:hypothetical protein
MDTNRLRAVILKLHDYLSDEDWKRLHFYLGSDPLLQANISLTGSHTDQDKINEKQFTFLTNLLERTECSDAMRVLKGKLCFHFESFLMFFSSMI